MRFLQKHNRNEKAEGANASHGSIEILAEMSSWPMTFINLSVISNSPIYRYRKLPELWDKEITEERQPGNAITQHPAQHSHPQFRCDWHILRLPRAYSDGIFTPHMWQIQRQNIYEQSSRGWHKGSSGNEGLKGVVGKLRLSKDLSSLATMFWDGRKHSTLKDEEMGTSHGKTPTSAELKERFGDVMIWTLAFKECKGR